MAFDNKYLQGNTFPPGTDWITIGVKIWFSTVAPGSAFDFFRYSIDAAGLYHLALRLFPTGQIQVLEQDGTSAYLSPENLVVADRWYLFEMKFKKSSSSDFRFWMDGSLLESISSRDFDAGGTNARVEIRTQFGDITPAPINPKCVVYCAGWYVITDDESVSTVVDFVGFETGGFEEVARFGASTIETSSPAPPSTKETYNCKVVADTGADPDD